MLSHNRPALLAEHQGARHRITAAHLDKVSLVRYDPPLVHRCFPLRHWMFRKLPWGPNVVTDVL